MKFSAAIVAVFAASSAVTEVSAFGVQNLAVRRSTFASTTTTRMALDDLEAKLLSDKSAPKRSKPVREKKEKKVKKAAPAPTPEPTPEPVAETKPAKKGRKNKGKKSEYDLSGVDEVAPPKPAPVKRAARISPRPAPVKKERPKLGLPKRKAKAVAAPKKDTVKDPNAGTVGVALGAAPLLLAPVVALSAARSALGKTAARRQAIQDEIAAKEAAAKAKADISADVDGGGVFAALVSNSYKILHWWYWLLE